MGPAAPSTTDTTAAATSSAPPASTGDVDAEILAFRRARIEKRTQPPPQGNPTPIPDKPADEQALQDGEQSLADAEAQPEEGAEEDADAQQADGDVDEEMAKATPWARRIKAELEETQKRVRHFEQREAQLLEASQRVYSAFEDTQDDLEFWRSMAVDLEALLIERGGQVDPYALKVRQLERENRRAQRQLKRGTQQESTAARAQASQSIGARIAAIVAQHPELDYRKSAAAREFFRERLEVPIRQNESLEQWLDRLEQASARFASTLRAEFAAKRTAQKQQTQKRPVAQTLAGATSAGGTRAPRPAKTVDEEYAEWKRAREARRAAR
jgi:hypothetical protein